MKLTFLALATALLATGCTTDAAPVRGVVAVPFAHSNNPGDGLGCLAVQVLQSDGTYALPHPGQTPNSLRVRLNGDYLVEDFGQGLDYVRIIGGGGGARTMLPEGAYVTELVDNEDRVWYRSPPVAVPDTDVGACSTVFVWSDATASWTWSATGDDGNPNTREYTIDNITDRPVTVMRCLWSGPSTDPTCTDVGHVPAQAQSTTPIEIDHFMQPGDPQGEVRVVFDGGGLAGSMSAGTIHPFDTPQTARLVDPMGWSADALSVEPVF